MKVIYTIYTCVINEHIYYICIKLGMMHNKIVHTDRKNCEKKRKKAKQHEQHVLEIVGIRTFSFLNSTRLDVPLLFCIFTFDFKKEYKIQGVIYYSVY